MGNKDNRDPRLRRSYDRAVALALEADKTPLFTYDTWFGMTHDVDGKTQSTRYKVRCNSCGQEYDTYFKTSKPKGKGVMACPYCSKGQKQKSVVYQAVLNDLKGLDYSPLFTEKEFNGRNKQYKVKCNKCGIEFYTGLSTGHFNKCPYCSESHAFYNQQAKVDKICEEKNLTLLEDYKKAITDGKRTKLKVKCNVCGTEFETFFIGKQTIGCPTCSERGMVSQEEQLIKQWLLAKGIDVQSNYRLHGLKLDNSDRNPFEIDLFIPSKKVGFELNGYYWHNSGVYEHSKPKNYHQQKTQKCLDNGIKLYHLWESISLELKKSIISTKLGFNKKVPARKCKVVEVSAQEAKQFFTKCHVDGFVRSSKYYALMYEGRYVCMITLMCRRLQAAKTNAWEIGRFASQLFTTVQGGYSKLLTYIIKDLKSIGCKQLVSYCNRDLSPDPNTTFYAKYGFKFLQDSGPIYKYWASKAVEYYAHVKHGDLKGRQELQKQKLLKWYQDNDLELPDPCTEYSLATGLGFQPVYNSGNFKYVLEL